MPKNKIFKDFAIKLIHPDFGDFYYSWRREHNYVFVKELPKVMKWKTTKFTEKQIKLIQSDLEKNKGSILLSFGDNVNDSLKSRMIISKKRYYFPITEIIDMSNLNVAKEGINKYNSEFKDVYEKFLVSLKDIKNDLLLKNTDEKTFINDINENILTFKNFVKDTNKLSKNIDNYLYHKNILEELSTHSGSYLDIVDASYNFRKLKLNTINKNK